MKGVREKDALSVVWNAGTKDQEFIENGKSNLIWFDLICHALCGMEGNSGVEKNQEVSVILMQK